MRGRGRLVLRLAVLACALAAAMPALAQQGAPEAGEVNEQVLYQQALQSLAEGRKSDASQALTRLIAKEPLHAGAWLDLALIQCSLGHRDEAERLFANVESRFNPSRDILELIAEARDSGCHGWAASSTLTLTAARGADRNVNQGASDPTFITERGGRIELPLLDEFLPKRDEYSALSAEYMRDVTPNGSIGFAQLQLRRNDHLHQYDTASLFAGIESPYRFGKWVLRTTGMLGAVALGGKFYQRQALLQARVTPPLSLPRNTEFHLMAAATRSDYLTLTNFNSNSLELRGQLAYRTSGLYSSASYGLMTDHARDTRPGGNRHGSFANVMLRKQLPWQLNGELGFTRQTWNSAQPYSPELLIDQVRAQDTQVLRASLAYPIGKHQALQVEARAVRNRENISIFQYNNRQLQLSWQWQP
jgi:hypothetical protein